MLVVRDLDRAASFYSLILNSEPQYRGGKAVFELEGSSLVLREVENAKTPPPGSSGLYHVAFTVDSLGGLGEAFRRIYKRRLVLQGIADHGYTIAVYTRDPDGNGVEVYWDKDNPVTKLVTLPVDMEWLAGLEPQKDYTTSIGHVHVKVPSLEEAEKFYSGLLGMKVTERNYPGALFFAYGNYHHHIGANIWETQWGAKGRKPPKPSIGMESYTISPPKTLGIPPGTYEDPASITVTIV